MGEVCRNIPPSPLGGASAGATARLAKRGSNACIVRYIEVDDAIAAAERSQFGGWTQYLSKRTLSATQSAGRSHALRGPQLG